jgi:hypothetical protein
MQGVMKLEYNPIKNEVNLGARINDKSIFKGSVRKYNNMLTRIVGKLFGFAKDITLITGCERETICVNKKKFNKLLIFPAIPANSCLSNN